MRALNLETETAETGPALRRRQILEAALEAFRIHGFHAASVALIAGGARMSVGQIYRYFDSKEALVAAIVETNLEEAVRDLTLLQDAEGLLADRLLDNLTRAVRRHIDSGFLSLMHEVRAEAARNPVLTSLFCRKDDLIKERLIELIAAAQGGRGDAAAREDQAERISIVFEGALMRHARQAEFDPKALRRLLRPLLLAILSEGLAREDAG